MNDTPITLLEYAILVGYNHPNPTLSDIQDFAENELDTTLWDYPIEEEEYVMQEVEAETVLVLTDIGVRICEIP